MEGDERKRFCSECSKYVYNLSAMSRADAEKLLARGEQICGRIYRRADGTILTEDCPVGLRAKAQRLRKRLSFALAGALGLSTAFAQSKLPDGVHIRAEESAQPEIVGTVTDTTGAVIPGAAVTITNDAEKPTIVRTDAYGRYRFSISASRHQIQVASPGFKMITVSDVQPGAKERRVIDVTLQVAATNMGVIVEAAPARK